MTDQVVKDNITLIVNVINNECVIGAGTPGMFLDGDRMFMLLYDKFNELLEAARLQDTIDTFTTEAVVEPAAEPKRAGRPVGSKNKELN